VSKYVIVSVCVMFWHFTPVQRLFCEDFNGGFHLKGGLILARYLH
jgi:hypothetical protein